MKSIECIFIVFVNESGRLYLCEISDKLSTTAREIYVYLKQ